MIDRDVFSTAWAKLCRRFGRKLEMAELDDYLAYLDGAGLTTDDFQAAAGALWATREFFPRPADFLQPQAFAGWSALASMAKLAIQSPAEEWRAARAKVPDRAWAAINTLGGLETIRAARDLIHVRKEYLAAYDAQVQEEAMTKALPPPEQPKYLAA